MKVRVTLLTGACMRASRRTIKDHEASITLQQCRSCRQHSFFMKWQTVTAPDFSPWDGCFQGIMAIYIRNFGLMSYSLGVSGACRPRTRGFLLGCFNSLNSYESATYSSHRRTEGPTGS